MSFVQDVVSCMVSDFIGTKNFSGYTVHADKLHALFCTENYVFINYDKTRQQIQFFWTVIGGVIPGARGFIDDVLLAFADFGDFPDYVLGELAHRIRSTAVMQASFVLQRKPESEIDTEVLL